MINIKARAEITIPFDKIGDPDWEIETERIIKALAENWDDDLAAPISEELIFHLEKRLKVELPDSLKLFYQKFGIAGIGEELQDLNAISYLGDIWKDAPQYGPDFSEEDKKHLPFLISFGDYLGNGNIFCFHSDTKEIFYFDHDSKPYLTKLFDDASDYIKGCLIGCQADLFDEDTGEEQVLDWCEEILIELFGSNIVKKWRY